MCTSSPSPHVSLVFIVFITQIAMSSDSYSDDDSSALCSDAPDESSPQQQPDVGAFVAAVKAIIDNQPVANQAQYILDLQRMLYTYLAPATSFFTPSTTIVRSATGPP